MKEPSSEDRRPGAARDGTPLPSPGVAFAPDYPRRLERLVGRVAAARGRREGPGRTGLSGVGEEFVGYRPYRPGEDLRRLDWQLLARLDRPFVKVSRREAGERWALLVDTSASMGLGRPGKLQLAAELVGGLAFLGLAGGARVRLIASSDGEELELERRCELPAWLSFLEGLAAGGERGLAGWAGHPRLAGADRLFLVGDLLDAPGAAVSGWLRRGRELDVVQVLAGEELAPPRAGVVGWIDPETGERLELEVDGAALASYQRGLEDRIGSWRGSCARHRAGFALVRSDAAFEDAVAEVLGR